MKITTIPLARREMLRAARRYEREKPKLGDRFPDAVRDGLIAILEFPTAHPPIFGSPYRRKLLTSFPFALVYLIEEDEIVVIAVANSSRKPRYGRGREAKAKRAASKRH